MLKTIEKPNATPSAKPASISNHVLIAEDDDQMRALLTDRLRKNGYRVTECVNGMQLLDMLANFLVQKDLRNFDLIIADICMPGMTGLEILEGLGDCKWMPPIILTTAFGDEDTHSAAQRAGAAAICDKPFEFNQLLQTVHEIVPRQPLASRLLEHKRQRRGGL